jgi:ADP-ribosylglycohydrolase
LPPSVRLTEVARQHGAARNVVESVAFALTLAQQRDHVGFAVMPGQVVLAGGDTETNASLAGQLAGSSLGLTGLPTDLVAELPRADMVVRIAGRFADAVTSGA